MSATPPSAGALELRPLRTSAELRACVELQRRTWGQTFAEVVPPALLLAVQRLGGVAAGAFAAGPARSVAQEDATGGRTEGPGPVDGGQLVGFVFGVPGIEHGEPVHWSDMLAVSPDARDRGLGERLKLWQREAVLARGYRVMRWTFDPLESRNAWLNLSRLGALCREYVRDMYADMDSPLHAGIGTDRLVVRWELDSPRVRRRLAGEDAPLRPGDVAGVPVVNALVRAEPDPTCAPSDLALDAPRLLLAIPGDIQRLKQRAPELARAWRAETRAGLLSYFERGYTASALIRFGAWSGYLLER